VNKFSIILAILLYVLIYFIRLQQGGWEFKTEILKDFRAGLDNQISSLLPTPQAELLSGILLGQNEDLPGRLRLALRDTSTLHIVVASGQNLSMLAGFCLLLSGLIKRKLAISLSFLAITFYVLLTGAEIPILRAAVMVSLTFLAQVIGREKDGAWVLFWTVALMLLINPNWLFELSFQLSVLATTGLVILAPIIMKRLKFLPIFIKQDLSVSLGAQLLVLPIIAQNFHQFSLVALPANLLVLWTIPFIMIGGAILILLSFITPPLAVIVASLLNALLSYFVFIVSLFGSYEFAWIYVGEQMWLVWLGYYLIIAALVKFLYESR
jgi:competence protein ComEC